MSDSARHATVKANAYLTGKKDSEVKRAEPALVVSGENGKEILLISKSDAMRLIDDMRQILKKMI